MANKQYLFAEDVEDLPKCKWLIASQGYNTEYLRAEKGVVGFCETESGGLNFSIIMGFHEVGMELNILQQNSALSQMFGH